MADQDSYTRDDLLGAWLASEAARASHPDIADYHYRRAWALGGAFGGSGPAIHYGQAPEEHRRLLMVFERSVTGYNAISAPWGQLLSGRLTPDLAEVETAHRAPLDQAADGLRAAYRALMLDLMERIWGIGAERTVSRESVTANGFDPETPEPDLDLYW